MSGLLAVRSQPSALVCRADHTKARAPGGPQEQSNVVPLALVNGHQPMGGHASAAFDAKNFAEVDLGAFLSDPQHHLRELYEIGGQAAVATFMAELERVIGALNAQLPIVNPKALNSESTADGLQTSTGATANHLVGPHHPEKASLRADLNYLVYVQDAAKTAQAELTQAKAAAVAAFETQASQDALHVLDVSEARAQLAYKSYGLSSSFGGGVLSLHTEYAMKATPEVQELALAAGALREKLAALEDAKAELELARLDSEDLIAEPTVDVDGSQFAVDVTDQEYQQLLVLVSRHHPVLASLAGARDALQNLTVLSKAPSAEASRLLHDSLDQTLQSIGHLRAKLNADPKQIWKLPTAVQASLQRNPNFAEGTLGGAAVREAVKDRQPSVLKVAAETALYFGLGLAASAFPGGIAFAATAVAGVLGARDAIEHLEDFTLAADAFNGTSIADSPLAKEAPSAVLTALAMAGALGDVVGAGKALGTLMKTRGLLRSTPAGARRILKAQLQPDSGVGRANQKLLHTLDAGMHGKLAEAQMLRRAGRGAEAQRLIDELPLPLADRVRADLLYRVTMGELPDTSLRLVEELGPTEARRILDGLGNRASTALKTDADIDALIRLKNVEPRALRQSGLRVGHYESLRASEPPVFDAMMANRRWSRELSALARPDLSNEAKARLSEAMTTLYKHKAELDADSVFGTLKHTKCKNTVRQAIEATAELRTGARILSEGKVAPGTKLAFNVTGKRKVKLSATQTYDHSQEPKGVMSEVDVLYRGDDGKLHAVDVKNTAAALADKIRQVAKKNPDEPYLGRMVEWRDQNKTDRVAEVVIDSEERWDQLLSLVQVAGEPQPVIDAVADMQIELTVAQRAWSSEDWRSLAASVDRAIKDSGISFRRFMERRAMPRRPQL